jgi:hypothetical protein
MIAPLWTDLYPDGVSTFRTEGTANYQKYFWNNLGEISNTNNRNTFSLEIRPSGFIGANYTQINMNQTAWVGTVGNATSGQVNEIYYGSPGINYTGLTGWTQASTPADACFANPLSSPTCSGYTEAMCAANPLYSQTCAGYQQAYLNQQCSANPLYNTACPGYAAAYLSYQCSINPLYSTTCEGYETAYFNQQCSENPLYNTSCPGYAEAYRTQQCSINPLFSTTCTGYADAYFSQQCRLNGLYDRQCPNYSEAYATKMLLERQGTASTVATAGAIAAAAPKQPEPSTDSSGEVKVAVVADQNVNDVISTTATSASPAQAATATVPLVVAPQVEAPKPVEKPAAAAEKPQGQTTTQPQQAQSGEKPQPTARQQLAERRAEAAKKDAVEKGKNLANEMGKVADMEAQKQVQNVVIAAMGFTPGFDAYGKAVMLDVVGYKPFAVYANQNNVDNKRLGRGLYGPSDRLHNALVESQYNRGN